MVTLSGILPTVVLIQAIVVGWLLKMLTEVIFTPITYVVVAELKKAEKEDYYDRDTDFNPFIINK